MSDKPFKDFEKPREPFIYVAGRAYLKEKPKELWLPEALTEQKGDRIAGQVGKLFAVRFDISSRIIPERVPEMYSHFASGKAVLEDFAKIPIIGEGFDWDWVYRFKFKADDPLLMEKLLDRKDKCIDAERAFQRATAHWGCERWSGLTLDLVVDKDRLLRTDIDVFAPSAAGTKPDIIIVGAYSHKQKPAE